MKKLLLIMAVAATFFTACKKESVVKTTFNISGAISNTDADSLIIYDASRNELTKIGLDETGNFTGNVTSNTDGLHMLRVGREFATFYAAPGDLIEVELDAKEFDETITYAGDHEAENNYLAQKTLMAGAQAEAYGIANIAKLGKDEFASKLQEKYSQNSDLLNEALSEGADEKFLALEKKSIEMAQIDEQLIYPDYHNYVNKTEIEFDDSYYDFLADVDINDDLAAKSSVGINVLSQKIERMAPASDYTVEGHVDFFIGQLNKVKTGITSKFVQETLFHKLLNEKINYGGGLDGLTDEIDFYNKLSSNNTNKDALATLVSSWEKVKAGNDAPQFSGITRAGEKVQLADLKGKNVYVDVWATWCGPCKAEIPSLKAVEKEYHGKNIEFVSISIDELKDKETWKQFVEDNNLGGTQIFAENAWQSEVTKGYNIKGIPRFILIDANGKIVSADAPRPSNDRLKKVFDETLEKS